MDRSTIKSIIIDLKKENKSFTEISNILYNQYSIQMTRQAVCGMYNRAVSDENIAKNTDMILATNDIMNFHLLGLPSIDIKEKLEISNYSFSASKVSRIINSNKELLVQLETDVVDRLVILLKNDKDIDEIKLDLTYKGVEPRDKVLYRLIYKATMKIIAESATETLASIYNLTENKELINAMIISLNLDITSKDVMSKI